MGVGGLAGDFEDAVAGFHHVDSGGEMGDAELEFAARGEGVAGYVVDHGEVCAIYADGVCVTVVGKCGTVGLDGFHA